MFICIDLTKCTEPKDFFSALTCFFELKSFTFSVVDDALTCNGVKLYIRGMADCNLFGKSNIDLKRSLCSQNVVYSGEMPEMSMADRRKLGHLALGKTVTVFTDRPLGTYHPEKPNMYYPINYGYVKSLIGGDGEEQDAYILGVDTPVDSFQGVVCAVIYRSDDSEDKWVVAPKDAVLDQAEIADAVHFQEQFHFGKIECLYEKSAGAILFSTESNERRYLIIRAKKGHCGFPKGHLERGESELCAAIREIREETGLSAKLYPDFRLSVKYPLNDKAMKESVYFLGTFSGDIAMQEAEVAEIMLLPYEQALKTVSFENDRELLRKAESFLLKNNI